jgi:hypothetical protein
MTSLSLQARMLDAAEKAFFAPHDFEMAGLEAELKRFRDACDRVGAPSATDGLSSAARIEPRAASGPVGFNPSRENLND